ncbi:hypothetical protein [Hymenobacter tenuis]
MGRTDGVEGSPYADKRWLQANLTMSSQVPLAPVPLKYDVLNQRLIMRKQGTSTDSIQLDDRLLLSFVLQEPATATSPARSRVFRRFTEAPVQQHRTQFVEVLHEGKYVLLKQHLKAVRKAPVRSGYGVDVQSAQVEDVSVYYVRRPNAEVVPVKLNMKSLTAAAPALAPALKGAKPATEADWVARLAQADPK